MKKVITILALALTTTFTFAQDTPLEISGSGDLYYKYDFAGYPNIGTSFASEQNSPSLGMIDIALKKKTGKASFVGEVSFGPRGQFQSIPNADGMYNDNSNSFNIQNLYAAYAVSDKLTLTAGYMATFVGYEVISPVGNFHYSTSYLFTNGPFQNAGLKATYAISSKVAIMAGMFSDGWNVYKANPDFGLNTYGAQLALTPIEGLSAYINILTGSNSGTILDLTAAYQITDKFKLGVNVADFSGSVDDTGFTGFALYPSYAFTDKFSLGVRAENFSAKKMNTAALSNISADESVTALTLSANLKAGGLTFIPEFRTDGASVNSFQSSGKPGLDSKTATQATLAVVFAF